MTDAPHPPNALPKFLQISEFLVREIAAGRLIDGARLAPERNMAQDLGVSVGTLRKSLDALEKQGLLERVQGSGNYIRHGNVRGSVYAMFRLELLDGGGLPKARVLDVHHMRKPSDLPDFGQAETGSRIRRERRLNDTIIAIEEIWLDAAAGLVEANTVSESLYQYYRTKLGVWITQAEDQVSIAAVPDWAPSSFPLTTGTVTGFIERFSWSDLPSPVEYSRTWFDTTTSRYVQRLK